MCKCASTLQITMSQYRLDEQHRKLSTAVCQLLRPFHKITDCTDGCCCCCGWWRSAAVCRIAGSCRPPSNGFRSAVPCVQIAGDPVAGQFSVNDRRALLWYVPLRQRGLQRQQRVDERRCTERVVRLGRRRCDCWGGHGSCISPIDVNIHPATPPCSDHCLRASSTRFPRRSPVNTASWVELVIWWVWHASMKVGDYSCSSSSSSSSLNATLSANMMKNRLIEL